MKDNKVFRFTFSNTLAYHIRDTYLPGCEIRKFKLRTGQELKEGERSRNGLYAIMSRRKNRILRLTHTYDTAQLLCDWDSRYLAEAGIVK